jgi:hypothetical protein
MMQRKHVGTDHEMRGVQVCHHADGIRLCLSTILVDMHQSAPRCHVMQEKKSKESRLFSRLYINSECPWSLNCRSNVKSYSVHLMIVCEHFADIVLFRPCNCARASRDSVGA